MAVLDQPSMHLSRQLRIRAGVADEYPRHGYPSFSSLFPKIHIICRDGGPWQSRMGLFGYRIDRTYLPSGYPITVNPDLGEGQRVAVHPLEMPLCDRLRGESFASTLRSVRCGSGPCHGMYVRNSSSEPAARLGGGRRRYRRPSPGRLPVAPRGQRRLARSPCRCPSPPSASLSTSAAVAARSSWIGGQAHVPAGRGSPRSATECRLGSAGSPVISTRNCSRTVRK